jgi:hypothetical protein
LAGVTKHGILLVSGEVSIEFEQLGIVLRGPSLERARATLYLADAG